MRSRRLAALHPPRRIRKHRVVWNPRRPPTPGATLDISRTRERLMPCKTSAKTGLGGEVGKLGLAQTPAWKLSDMPWGNGLSLARHWTPPIAPNAAVRAGLCSHAWVQPPMRSDACSPWAAEISTAYTNKYPYGFALRVLELEYFLMTQLNATITSLNTLLPFWPQVQYQNVGNTAWGLRN